MLGSGVAHKVQGHGRGVGQGLVHVVLDFGEVPPELVRGNHLADVLHRNQLRELPGVVGLVIALAIVKAHGEGLVHIGRAGHIAGIHPGAQEGAHLHVADFVGLHAVVKGLLNVVHPLLQRAALLCLEAGQPVAGDFHFAIPIEKVVGRGQLVHVLEKGLRPRGVLKAEIAFQGLFVQLFLEVRVQEEALDF